MSYPVGRYSEDTQILQRALIAAGFKVGKAGADGKMGDDTIKAIGDARDHYGLPAPRNKLDLPLLIALGVRSKAKPKTKGLFDMNSILGNIFTGLFQNLLNWQLIQGYLRNALTAMGGVLVTNGVLTSTELNTVIGAVMIIASVTFTAISNNTKKKAVDVVKAVDAAPQVNVIPASETPTGKPKVVVEK